MNISTTNFRTIDYMSTCYIKKNLSQTIIINVNMYWLLNIVYNISTNFTILLFTNSYPKLCSKFFLKRAKLHKKINAKFNTSKIFNV